ncbi:Holliday junction resolvase RuvX, partial [bacterium]|nr:Holliday junction resolvase RuvX [bacterium]
MPACLGFDYGLRRIGIAACDAESTLAFPVTTHVEGRDGSIFGHVATLIREREVTCLVVGLPLTADGREGDMAKAARGFAGKLEKQFETA